MRSVNSIAVDIGAQSRPMISRAPLPTSSQAIAQRLRKLREASGLGQADFAKLCGIGKTAWANYESGLRRISPDQAFKVCDATGVTTDWIYRNHARGMDPTLLLGIQRGALPPKQG